MVHSDDMGLVLPPKVAQVQVVIIAIEKVGDESTDIMKCCNDMFYELKKAGVRVEFDDREIHKSGWKFNHWEQRGVPIRLEVGRKDLEANEVRCAKRHDGVKMQLKREGIAEYCKDLLETIHKEMYEKALSSRLDHTKDVDNWKDFMEALSQRNLCKAAWCNVQQCEKDVKERSKEESTKAMEEGDADEAALTGAAKTLCIPHEQTPIKDGEMCFACGKPATTRALWGRSY
mgnify:CR=1 FL=1